MMNVRHMKCAAALAGVVSVGALLAACGQGNSGVQSSSVQHVLGAPQVYAFDSAAQSVSSLQDVADDTTDIVVAVWTGKSHDEFVGGTPYPVSEMQITEVIQGTMRSGTVAVRLGYTDVNTGRSPLDTEGAYLLFLKPFWFEPGKSTGQYTTAAGPYGVFFTAQDSGTDFTSIIVNDDGMSGVRAKELGVISLKDVAGVSVSTSAEIAARDSTGESAS